MTSDDLMTTGEAAARLGVSRQTVVNLCEQGKLPSVRVGSHRRVPRDAVESYDLQRRGWETDGHQKSLALHALVVGELLRDPERVRAKARRNLRRFPEDADTHRRRWEELLDEPLPVLITAMLDTSDTGVTLRAHTPFAGVLNAEDRARVNRAYRATR